MKNLNTLLFLVLFLSSNTLLSAQHNKGTDHLKNLFGDTEYFKSQNPQLYKFDSENKTYKLKHLNQIKEESNTSNFFTKPQTAAGFQITETGLLDQSGTTYHIRIKEPDDSNLAKMPTKKY